MATNVSLNGTSYSIPDIAETGYGTDLRNYLIALATGVLSKAGGSFTLTAEVDFGATYGLKTEYVKDRGTTSSSGSIRLSNNNSIGWRDNANSADKLLKTNTSDLLEFDGAEVTTHATVSKTEYNYLSGVTSAVQTQLDAKLDDTQLIDDDTMATATSTNIPSAESIKAYVDNEVSSLGTALNADINQVSSTNYTILDGDGYRHIHVTTGASDRTITLPTAADNIDRILSFKKIDSGSGNLIIDGEGAETIEDAATYTLTTQYSMVTLVCDGSEWFIVGSGEATPNNLGLVKKPKTQTKLLSTSQTYSAGAVVSSDLTFNNLDTSKFYMLTGQVRLNLEDGANDFGVVFKTGSTEHGVITLYEQTLSGTRQTETLPVILVFQPTTSTLTMNFKTYGGGSPANSDVIGDNTRLNTFLTLTETNIQETTDFT